MQRQTFEKHGVDGTVEVQVPAEGEVEIVRRRSDGRRQHTSGRFRIGGQAEAFCAAVRRNLLSDGWREVDGVVWAGE